MSRFSSYPDQQLLFENWRSYNEDADLVMESLTEEQVQLIQEKLDEVLGYGALATGKVSSELDSFLEKLDWILMVVGLIPGIGIVADVISALLLYLRGHPWLALFSIVAAIPAVGYAGVAIKGIAKATGKDKSKREMLSIAMKSFVPLMKKALGESWAAKLKRYLTGSIKEADEVTAKIVNKYYKKNPDEVAKVIDDAHEFFMDMERDLLKLVAKMAGGAAVGYVGATAALAADGSEKEAPEQSDKLVYDFSTVQVYQVEGVGYVLEVEGKVIGKTSLEVLKQILPEQGWKI